MAHPAMTRVPTRDLIALLGERLALKVIGPALNLLPERTLLRVRSGPLRGALWAPRAFGPRCWLGTYELDKQHWFVEHARPGRTVYDIGAHTGYYTILASRLVVPAGRVVAFEPSPRNISYLRRHIGANECGNVTVYEGAVGDVPGEAMFDNSGASDIGGLAESGALKVRLFSVDDLVSRGEIPPPSVMKIDVEGAEDRVLRGARRTIAEHRPTIMVATHSPEVFDLCSATLREAGYELRGAAFERPKYDEILALPGKR